MMPPLTTRGLAASSCFFQRTRAATLLTQAQVAVDVVPLPLLFEDLLLSAEPVLFVLAGFKAAVFI